MRLVAGVALVALPAVSPAQSGVTAVRPRPGFAPRFEQSGALVTAIAIAPDGSVFVAGSISRFGGSPREGIVKLHADGTLDTGFVPAAPRGGEIVAIALQEDGKIVVGGRFTKVGGQPRAHIARLSADGSLDTSFDPGEGFNDDVAALAIQGDGKIFAGGRFSRYHGSTANRIVRLKADGALDATFATGTGFNSDVSALAVAPAGRIIVGGMFSAYNGEALAAPFVRLDANGVRDTSFFQPYASDWMEIRTLHALPDGGYVVGGVRDPAQGASRSRMLVARVGANGAPDTSFSPALNDLTGVVSALQVDAAGRLIVAGSMPVGASTTRFVTRLSSTGAVDQSFDLSDLPAGYSTAVALASDGRIWLGENSMAGANRGLWLLGSNGTADATFSPTIGRPAYPASILPAADGKWLVGGAFTWIDDVVVNSIARLNTDGSVDATFASGAGFNGTTRLALQSDGKIVAAGSFTSAAGTSANRIARLQPDGSLDAGFVAGAGFDGEITAVQTTATGQIVVAGSFTTYQGQEQRTVARLNADGLLDATLDPDYGFHNSTYAALAPRQMIVQPDGRLLVAVDMYSYYRGESLPVGIVRLGATGARDGFGIPEATYGSISSLLLQSDGKVVVTGWLPVLPPGGSNHFYNLARLLAGGGMDPAYTPLEAGTQGLVATLLQPDGKVIVAGTGRLEQVLPDGGRDPQFTVSGVGAGWQVYTLARAQGASFFAAGAWTDDPGFAGRGLALLEPPQAPTITSAATATGRVGEPFSYTITGSEFPNAFAATGLPAGLVVDEATGEISGAPAAAGHFTVTIQATNGGGSGDADLELAIGKGSATVAISETTQDFSGSARPVGVTTTPAGLAVEVTYAGSAIAPSAIGTYAVTATVVDADYEGSADATLTIRPAIVGGESGTISFNAGSAASLTASAGPGGSYQWQVWSEDGGDPFRVSMHPAAGAWVDIAGATAASYVIPSAQRFHQGRYRVVVTIGGTTFTSGVVTLAIEPPPPSSGRLGNLSARAMCFDGDQVLIPGFVINGTSTKRLLVRAVGASLGNDPFGMHGVLADPRMVLQRLDGSHYEQLHENDNWRDNPNAAEIEQATAAMWAFPLTDDHDAALLVDLAPGQYTIIAHGVAAGTGLAIVELYDADDTGDSRLGNISNRGFAGVGDQVMIPGFVVTHEGPKTLLLRVVGPTLAAAPYNVSGTMTDPKLTVFRREQNGSETQLWENDDWGASPDAVHTAEMAGRVWAFPLAEGSKDAALVATLEPGTYTVIGSSADGLGTGVILVEVYVVE